MARGRSSPRGSVARALSNLHQQPPTVPLQQAGGHTVSTLTRHTRNPARTLDKGTYTPLSPARHTRCQPSILCKPGACLKVIQAKEGEPPPRAGSCGAPPGPHPPPSSCPQRQSLGYKSGDRAVSLSNAGIIASSFVVTSTNEKPGAEEGRQQWWKSNSKSCEQGSNPKHAFPKGCPLEATCMQAPMAAALTAQFAGAGVAPGLPVHPPVKGKTVSLCGPGTHRATRRSWGCTWLFPTLDKKTRSCLMRAWHSPRDSPELGLRTTRTSRILPYLLKRSSMSCKPKSKQ